MRLLPILALAFIALIMIEQAAAIGVSPGRRTIFFEEGLVQEVALTIYNDDGLAKRVDVSAQGELAQYISFSASGNGQGQAPSLLLAFQEGEKERQVTYRISLPQYLGPGVRRADIVVQPFPGRSARPGTNVGAIARVISEVVVQVPYPEKHAVTGIAASGDETGVAITVSAVNLGNEQIQSAKATINIFEGNYEPVATVETNAQSVPVKETRELHAAWQPPHKGAFYGEVTLDYDGKQAGTESWFDVGRPNLSVTSAEVKNFVLGGVARFTLTVENDWNEDFVDVYGQMRILENGRERETLKTPPETIPKLGTGALTAFWDTEDVVEGEYESEFTTYYGDAQGTTDMRFFVNLNSITTEIAGLSGRVTAAPGPITSQLTTLRLLVGALVLVNIGLVWVMLRRRKGAKKKKGKAEGI